MCIKGKKLQKANYVRASKTLYKICENQFYVKSNLL